MTIPEETYMTSGAHIGTRQKTSDIKDFIYKVRNDGLYIIDVKKTDERIKTAAKFISKFDPNTALIVSVRQYGQKPIKMLSDSTGVQVLDGRFRPGTLTNPSYRDFFEPDVVFVIDPLIDEQVIKEARKRRVPIVALCDTFNISKDIDLCIPVNNNGRKSISLILWLMAREILKNRGDLKKNDDYKLTIKDFGSE